MTVWARGSPQGAVCREAAAGLHPRSEMVRDPACPRPLVGDSSPASLSSHLSHLLPLSPLPDFIRRWRAQSRRGGQTLPSVTG